MSSNSPFVSVVIPTYNRGAIVPTAIESVLGQTFEDYEVIVVDDGSTDDTSSVLAKFGDRIRVIRQRNSGVSVARNTGIGAARGSFIAFLDSDDYWEPNHVERAVRLGQTDRSSVAYVSNLAFLDEAKQPIADLFSVKRMRTPQSPWVADEPLSFVMAGGVMPSALIVRASALQAVGGFPPRLSLYEDFHLFLRLACLGPFTVDPEVSSYLRSVGKPGDALSDEAVRRPITAACNLVRCYRDALPLATISKQRALLGQGLSERRFDLAVALCLAGRHRWARRQCLVAAARSRSPRGVIKCLAGACCGKLVLEFVIAVRTRHSAGFTRARAVVSRDSA